MYMRVFCSAAVLQWQEHYVVIALHLCVPVYMYKCYHLCMDVQVRVFQHIAI